MNMTKNASYMVFLVISLAIFKMCLCRSIMVENPIITIDGNENDTRNVSAENQMSLNGNNNANELDDIPIRQQRSRNKNFFEFPEVADTKEFKTGYVLNPAIVSRFNSIISLGKSRDTKPLCTDSESTIGGGSSASSSSSSSSSSSTSSSAASSSFSSSASTSSSSSSSSSAAAASLPSSDSIPSSESELPTNEQYFPVATSETQSNNDINNLQQYYDEQQEQANNGFFNKFETHKKTWSRIMNAPAHAIQKMRKFHADLVGVGPLYGSDHFANKGTLRAIAKH